MFLLPLVYDTRRVFVIVSFSLLAAYWLFSRA
jgi:hypothetical protein